MFKRNHNIVSASSIPKASNMRVASGEIQMQMRDQDEEDAYQLQENKSQLALASLPVDSKLLTNQMSNNLT